MGVRQTGREGSEEHKVVVFFGGGADERGVSERDVVDKIKSKVCCRKNGFANLFELILLQGSAIV